MRAIITLVTVLTFTVFPASYAQKEISVCESGQINLQSGNIAEAISDLESCLDTEEMDASAELNVHSALGAAYLYEERYEDSLRTLNMAFAIASTRQSQIANPIIWRNRGIARSQLDNLDGALDDLQHAVAMMPDDVLAYLNIGAVYQQMDRPADAVVAYDHVVRLEPGWMAAWLNRSSALLDAGMTTAAVADARRAVELEPENGSSLNMLCWTLIQDGRAQTALPLCEQAVAADPEVGSIVHSHATALEAVGRTAEALDLFGQAHRLSPEDPEITADFERTHNP
jgi:tetratricopeptide (TPR) repeat protein